MIIKSLPVVESNIDETILVATKEKFSLKSKDALNKKKLIKSTLELMVYTNCEDILVLLDEVESSDWF